MLVDKQDQHGAGNHYGGHDCHPCARTLRLLGADCLARCVSRLAHDLLLLCARW
jgi:hypothetical protein